MQAAGAHRLDLCGVGLHREEHDLFPGRLRQVIDEAVPYLGVNRRVLDRRIGEDQGRWVDPKFWIGRRIGDEIAVAIAIGLVEIAARAVLGVGEADQSGAEDECRKKRRDGYAVPRHGLPPSVPAPKALRRAGTLGPARQLSPQCGKEKLSSRCRRMLFWQEQPTQKTDAEIACLTRARPSVRKISACRRA